MSEFWTYNRMESMNFCLLVIGVGIFPLLLHIVLCTRRLFWLGGKIGVAACGGESDETV